LLNLQCEKDYSGNYAEICSKCEPAI
jgi:hypothetical protein